MKTKHIVWIIALILFIIPLFWLKSGGMDLGGDSNRLFFMTQFLLLKIRAYTQFLPRVED